MPKGGGGERERERPGGIHFGSKGFEGEKETEHELVILLGIEIVERAIPLPVKQAHSIPIEYVDHVGNVPRRRCRCRWRWTNL